MRVARDWWANLSNVTSGYLACRSRKLCQNFFVPAASAQPALKQETGLFASAGKQTTVITLLLIVITLAVYNPVVSHPFVNYDDDRYVTANAHVRNGLSAETIRWAITSTDQANWHPLTWISHAVDVQLFRLNPTGHHFSSLLIHSANVTLLFLLLMWATGRIAPSTLAALLFALHPINVESVAWVAERKNVLCAFFFLLSLGAYGWYVKKQGWRRYFVVAVCFVAALASKPMAITLPFALLLIDAWPLGRIRRWLAPSPHVEQKPLSFLILEKLPLLLLSIASAVITIVAQQSGGAMRASTQFSLGLRLANAVHSYALYLWKFVWPAHLAPMYPHPGNSLSGAVVALCAAGLVAVSAAVFAKPRNGYLAAGWLWFLGTMVPVIGLIQVGDQAMADRYAYIPFLGLFVMFAFGLADVLQRLFPENDERQHVAIASIALVLLCSLALTTRAQLSYWQNNESLWQHSLAVTDRNFIAQDNLAGALLLAGKTDEAASHSYSAAQINPRDPMSHGNIGAYLLQKGQLPHAIEELKRVTQLTTDRGLLASAYANLGTAYRESGDSAQARQSYGESLRLNSGQASAWIGMGILVEQQGDLQQAAIDFGRGAELQPTPEAFLHLGRSLAHLDRNSEARLAFENALKLRPDFGDAQSALDSLGSK